ncbi:lipopolysaccharide assembly protein LapB [Helicobacter sp. MIT 14-3879]|uniref:tetratricopeptide repeat protein n=1 Tax=Helicobacter sp. MIT 14-3879 TaxID=2040649 RepID=UPI000E1E8C64|nr:hypothetical protein [Helicobacter sp. MIT 14-3879]RDU65133.1 hypothetical protein CQA44_02130 [Helicobacter sp. MIT 14-3879]
MDSFFSFYKDPLFSIIIIISIIIIVAIADYTRNRFKLKEKKDSLNALANNFNYYKFDENINTAIEISKAPIQTLTFIANIYVSNGNFDEAIKIYLSILDKTKDIKNKMDIFELLGMTYYKAGFMQRAKNIFIEILKNNPRNFKVLSLLMQTYETLGEYKNAYDVISCIEELEGKMDNVKKYIKILILINDSIMPPMQREKEILKINSNITNKLTLSYIKQNNLEKFWELILNTKNIYNCIDILWNLDNPPLELIKNHKEISDVYRAKGIINDNIECDIFELETIRILNKNSSKNGTLGFKYCCASCQGIFPFETHRCQSCGELGSMNLVLEIMERKNEKNYSLL